MIQHVLHRKHPTPGAAEQVQRVETQRSADRHQLFHEVRHGPEGRVAGAIRPAAAQLVVEDDTPAIGQILQRGDVVVGHSRTAVQAQERDAGAVADRIPPDPATVDVE